MKAKNWFFAVLGIAVLLRIYTIAQNYSLHYDSAVYIGIGKYLFSGGTVGFFEKIRPPLLPILLGFAWKLGINPYYFGAVLDFAVNIASVCLVYIISKKMFNEKTALLAAILLALNPLYVFFSGRVFTSVLSVFFVLLAFWLIIEKKELLAGLVLGLAFLARFPAGIFLACFLLFYTRNKKDSLLKKSGMTLLGFSIPVIPYLIINAFAYGNPLKPFTEAMWTVGTSESASFLYYLFHLFISTPLNILLPLGIILLLKDKKAQKHLQLAMLCFLLPLIYFMAVSHKEPRYLLIIMPFISIFLAWAVMELLPIIRFRMKKLPMLFAVIIYFLAINTFAAAPAYYFEDTMPQEIIGLYSSPEFTGKNITTSSPHFIAYNNGMVEIIYFIGKYAYASYIDNARSDYLILNECHLYCAKEDSNCQRRTDIFKKDLDRTSKFELDHEATLQLKDRPCSIYVYKRTKPKP